MTNSSYSFMRYDATDINDPLLSEQLKEINETEETRSRCLKEFCSELKNLKDIEPCLEENFLLCFLRVSKYDTSKALQRVLKYYQYFDVFVNIYKKFSFPLHQAESIRHLKISPYRCHDNSFLIFLKAGIDYKKFTFGHRFYLEQVAFHQFLENPVNQICGGTYIFDYEGFGIHGYLAFTPFWMRMLVESLVNTFPCRLRAVHLVNMPKFFPFIMKLVNPFLPKKIQNRVFMHTKSDWENLHTFLSPDILPENYGGKLRQHELIDALDNFKEQDLKVRRLLAFGIIKTKKARQSLKVLQ